MTLDIANISGLDEVVGALKTELGENLYSCVLYGGAVRGDFVRVASDVNLLVVLNEHSPGAHQAIMRAFQGHIRVDPFIVGRPGLERSMQAFAVKFLSIQRDYKVLYGEDPIAAFTADPETEQFLCEQSLRNVRLRLVRAFVVFGQNRRRYENFLVQWTPTIFIDLGEALRLKDVEVPHAFQDRIPVYEREFGVDASVLDDLLDLKGQGKSTWFRRSLSQEQVRQFHARIFQLLTHVIQWMEARWPMKSPTM